MYAKITVEQGAFSLNHIKDALHTLRYFHDPSAIITQNNAIDFQLTQSGLLTMIVIIFGVAKGK